jgi:RNA polymerase primary sigma factor
MDTFGRYLENIARWPLLSADQEIELGRLIQAGIETSDHVGTRKPTRKELRIIRTGERSVDRMVLCNLRLVVSIAKKFVGHCDLHDIEDLVQYGSIGLKSAAQRFNPEKGYKFSTYATWWIRQEVQRGIYKADRIIRVPEHSRLTWARLQKQKAALSHELGRAPTSDELMKATDVKKEDFYMITRAMGTTTSLNAQLDGGDEIIGLLADHVNRNEIAPDYTALLDSLQILDDEERELIAKRFGLNEHPAHSFIELGKQYGITRQGAKDRVDKIQRRIKFQLSVRSA